MSFDAPLAPISPARQPERRADFVAPKPKLEIQKGPAAEAAERHINEHKAELKAALEPAKLEIAMDKNAGRFVNLLIDARTQEVILQYPNEGQLEFSRAVNAYLRAQAQGRL